MEISQVTVLVALFGIYSSSGEYFRAFHKVCVKDKEDHYSNMLNIFGKPTSIFLREEVCMFVSGSMLCSTGCGRLGWETALEELTVNI
jgi:hypothetical protein